MTKRARPGGKPSDALRAAAAETAKRLEAERWDAGDGGIIAQDILVALRAAGNADLIAFEAEGYTNHWIASVFKSEPNYWRVSGETRRAADKVRNTGNALRAVWYRRDRDLHEAARRHGKPMPVVSIQKRPSASDIRRAIDSLRASVRYAEAQGYKGDDPASVRRTMDWLAGQCNADIW